MTDATQQAARDESADPRARLLTAPMSPAQIMAVALCFCLSALDGFDVLSITFAAPAIAHDWGIGKRDIGLLLTSGLLGMAAGSLVLAPIADIVGRRRLLFLSLVLMTGGAFWTAVAAGIGDMTASRVVTGLGIGTMIAVGNPLAAEYANAKRRDFSLSLLNIGYPLGGVAGGFLAAILVPNYGWRSLFYVAAALGAVMLVLVWRLLPEPITYIVARPKPDSLARVNAYLARCRMAPVSALPPPPANAHRAPMGNLFRDGMAPATLTMTLIYFFYVITLFYMQSWVPSLVAGMGFATADAALVSVCMTMGGVVGGAMLGAAAGKIGLKPTVLIAIGGGAIFTAAFGAVPADLNMLKIIGFLTGMFLLGGMVSMYAVIARTYPSHMRASGTGFTVGIGRIGSAVGPALAGLLLARGVTGSNLAMIMAVPAIVSLLAMLAFRVRPITDA